MHPAGIGGLVDLTVVVVVAGAERGAVVVVVVRGADVVLVVDDGAGATAVSPSTSPTFGELMGATAATAAGGGGWVGTTTMSKTSRVSVTVTGSSDVVVSCRDPTLAASSATVVTPLAAP